MVTAKIKMNTIRRIVSLLVLCLLLASCSSANNDIETSESVSSDEAQNKTEESEAASNKDAFDEYFVLITVPTINVRSNPDSKNNDNKVDKVHMGETYTVFEQTRDSDYTWYRIGEKRWIANDGTWCVEYGTEDKKVCPYVLNDEEKDEFLSSIKTGAHCYSAYSGEVEHYINILNEPEYIFDYNIYLNNDFMSHSGLNDVYRYNISNVVKVDENTYDAYVVPIEDGGPVDHSTGCLRFSKIGIESYGDGEMLVFYITFIQNQNDVTDEKLKNVYNVELRYGPSQVSF